MTIALLLAALLSFAGSFASPTEPDRSLRSLAWLADDWFGRYGDLEMEERWMEPKGGMMLGVHRDVKNGRAVSFEFFRIEATDDGITYFAQPHGKPATPFKLVAAESKGNRAVFANPEHDFPKRILYWLSRDGALHARIEGDANSTEQPMEWTWRRGRVVPAEK